MKKETCCRVLNVPLDALPEEIREAYRKRMKTFHPDVFDGDGRCALVVREAWEVLRKGGPFSGHFEELAEELFPREEKAYAFPDFSSPSGSEEIARESRAPRENFPGAFSRERGSGHSGVLPLDRFLGQYVFPKRIVRTSELENIVQRLLDHTGRVVPPVDLGLVASLLNLSIQPFPGGKDGRMYRHGSGALSAGNIQYSRGKGVVFTGDVLSAEGFYSRYTAARLLGYGLFYPRQERSVLVGDFFALLSSHDDEEINTHRFAEELLLPRKLFSEYGGKVLWYMKRSRAFTYEHFVQKVADLFKVPRVVVEHRTRQFERRMRIAGTMFREERKKAKPSLLGRMEEFFL